MADILIRGMEMPKDGYVYVEMLLKVADGKVYYNYTGEKKVYTADFLTLPEGHGNMIDVDALEDMDFEFCDTDDCYEIKWRVSGRNNIRQIIKDAPIIVPAEGGNKNG